jgi:hypothetical protein
MSGLIWAGIGKGIADAGTTLGNALLRDQELKRQDEREALREQRLLERQTEAETRKEAREEAKAAKEADLFSQAEMSAPRVGNDRRFQKFKTDVGATDMAEDDLRQVFDQYYNQRTVGDGPEAARYLERYSKEKADVINELRRLGASSTSVKQATDVYKATLEAERQSDRQLIAERREDRRDREAAQRGEKTDAQIGLIGAQIKVAEARANRPDRSSGGASETQITNAERALTYTRDRIGKAFRNPTIQETVNAEQAKQYAEEKEKFIENHPDVKRQTQRLNRLYGGGDTEPSEAAPSPKPAQQPAIKPTTKPREAKDYSNLWK